MLKPKHKEKTCRNCKCKFWPVLPMQKVCGVDCAKAIASSERAKAEKRAQVAERRADKAKREKLKTRSDYLKEAQREFNRYVRFRDAHHVCISCGVHLADSTVGVAFDCGHYRSVGSAPHLRFHEDNAHAQCKRCNRWGAGRAVDYRLGLVVRIGPARLAELEADQTPRHYSTEDLKAIRDKYRALARQLEKKE